MRSFYILLIYGGPEGSHKLKMLLQTKHFTCKLKMLLQIKNRTCKLKIVLANQNYDKHET